MARPGVIIGADRRFGDAEGSSCRIHDSDPASGTRLVSGERGGVREACKERGEEGPGGGDAAEGEMDQEDER